MTLEQYIKAIQKQANGAQYVQLRESDGNLTPPMSINAAAEYLYGGVKPQTIRMPSEQITEKQDKEYSSRVVKTAEEKQKAKADDTRMRNFYIHGILPALTFGTSEIFTNGNPESMSLANVAGIGLKAAGRSYLPIALGTGLWSWYASTHNPPALDWNYGTRVYDTASTDSVGSAPVPIDTIGTPQPAPVQPTTGNTTSSESTASSASPEPERNDNTSSKLRRLLWETSKNSPKSSRIGRNLRNFGLRVPIYGTAANWGIPTIGNTVSFINTGKAPIKWPLTSYIPGVFDTDSATNQPKTLVPVQVNGQVYYVDPSQNTLATQQTDTIKAVTTNQLPDSTITNQGDDFEQWLKSRQTE